MLQRQKSIIYLAILIAISILTLVMVFSFQKIYSINKQKEIKVLFIGNSLTFFNDLPKMVKLMAETGKHRMSYEMYAPGGYTLSQHAQDVQVMERIEKGIWDYVVLQAQSSQTAYAETELEQQVYPYAQKLCTAIRQANPQAQIISYTTMAHRNGFSDQQDMSAYEDMQQKVIGTYTFMAKDNYTLLAPVGQAWQKVRTDYPGLDLYYDDIHPNKAGTYLAACVFYDVLFQSNSSGSSYTGTIPRSTAGILQKAADETCSTTDWNWER
jgi:hypothetical protein